MRTSNPEDMLTVEKAEQVLRTLEEVIQSRANKKQDEKTKAVSKLREVITDTQYALDVAFSAGTLATQTGYARADSVHYATNLQDGRIKEVFGEARIWLKSTIKKISELEKKSYVDSESSEFSDDFLEHWLGTDARPFKMAKDLIK